MANIGDLVRASDYNTIQSKIAGVLGVGTGTSGYGQSISSGQVTQYDVIRASAWNALRNDLIRARTHQTGVDESGNVTPIIQLNGQPDAIFTGSISGTTLTVTSVASGSVLQGMLIRGTGITSGTVIASYGSGSGNTGTYVVSKSQTVSSTAIQGSPTITAQFIETQYNTYADTIVTNKLAVASNQTTTENAITPYTRTSAWNGTITNTITITFPGYTQGSTTCTAADHARIFFNTGGNFQITSSRSGGSSTSKNTTWSTMLSDAGTVTMGLSGTSTSGTGTTYTVGWSNLTTTNQKIFYKPAPSGAYSSNQYNIYARRDSGSTQVIITVEYADLDTGGYQTGQFGPPPYGPGVDENVDGSLVCTCDQRRATGANVSVPTATVTQSGM